MTILSCGGQSRSVEGGAMPTQKKIAVIGGDERQIFAARMLLRQDFSVAVWGLRDRAKQIIPSLPHAPLQETLAGADAVVLPLPVSFDGIHLNSPFHEDGKVRLTSILAQMQSGLLLGGKLPLALRDSAEEKGITCVDYFSSDELQLRNAIPTVEGAIEIAMRELPVTLYGNTAAVIGYGRIGSLLARRLKDLGMRVYVYARRQEALVNAELQGMISCPLSGEGEHSTLASLPTDCRVLFNTVPVRLLSREVLRNIPRECLLIDLASIPGGIDQKAAEEMGIRSIWGTALPGKCAPESAGDILGITLSHLLRELF